MSNVPRCHRMVALLGGLVGLEREIHAHPAGLRTHILVCLGSCLITLVSVNMGHGSNDRIAVRNSDQIAVANVQILNHGDKTNDDVAGL